VKYLVTARGFVVVIWSLSLAAAITLIYFRFPGEMNNDSVSQFNQAVTNQYSDWHPPIMALLWHFLRAFCDGPGSLFVVHILFYWLGLTCCALYMLRLNRPFSALSCLGIGLIPVFLMIVINLHKDVGVAVAMVSAVGLICLSPAGLSFRLAAALSLLFYAALVRANAVFAVAPVLIFLLWRAAPRRIALFVVMSICLGGAMIPASSFVNHRLIGASEERAIQSLQLFDIAGTHSFSNVNDEMSSCYTPLFWDRLEYKCSALEKLRSKFTDAKISELWIKAITTHPLGYLWHRLAHFNSTMYFWVPSNYADMRALVVDRDRKPMTPIVRKPMDIIRYSPIFAPVVWVTTGIAILIIVLGRSAEQTDAASTMSVVLLASAILYMLSYLVVGVATDLRYQFWSMLAISLAAVFSAPIIFTSFVKPWRKLELFGDAMVFVVFAVTTTSRFVETDFLQSGLK
jgi:hypothetical protein